MAGLAQRRTRGAMHPNLASAGEAGAPPAASWEELRERAAGLIAGLAHLHAWDEVHGACDAAHVSRAEVAWLPGPGTGSRAADLQGFGTWMWTQVTGERPGVGRNPRFAVPEALVDLLGGLVHPEPLGRFACAADVSNALAALGPAATTAALLLPDASNARAPRPPPPEEYAPGDVVDGLWSTVRRARAEGLPRLVSVTGGGSTTALLALVRALECSGAGAVSWVGLGDDSVAEGQFEPASPTQERALRLARAIGGSLDEALAVDAAREAWLRSDRWGEDLALATWLREVRGGAWRGVSVVVLTGLESAQPGSVARIVDALVPPADRGGDLTAVPIVVVADGSLGRDEPQVPIPPAEALPAIERGGRRLEDLRHLVGLAGRVLPTSVITKWGGHATPTFLADPGVQTWGGRTWIAPERVHAWREEALGRPDHRYLCRRVAVALRRLTPARAATFARRAGDDELTEALALEVAGPRPPGPGPRSAASSVPAPVAVAAATLLSTVPSKTLALSRRALRAEHLAFERAWAGVATRAADWLAESRATEGSGEAGLRRAMDLGGLRLLSGDQVGFDAAFEEALGLADDDELGTVWARRASWSAWVGRWEAARVAIRRGTESERLRPLARGELALAEAVTERGGGAFAAARAAAAAAAGWFVEAGSLYGEVRASLVGQSLDRAERRPVDQDERNAWWTRAAEAGASDLCAEVAVFDGAVARDAGDPFQAARRYREGYRWAQEVGHLELTADAALGLARTHLGRGEGAEATDWGRRAVHGLGGCPRHPVWGPYRLLGAVLLAERADHTQTWQWLWSAQEAGIAELTDPDVAADLTRLVNLAEAHRWGNVLRLAGKLAAEHQVRLGDRAGAEALSARVADSVRTR